MDAQAGTASVTDVVIAELHIMKKKISIIVMLAALLLALYFIFFPVKIPNQPPQPGTPAPASP